MDMISKVKAALEGVFGHSAMLANQLANAVKRRRKFTPVSLAQTFILGLLSNPRASAADLARSAALAGVEVSPQAIDKRFTPELAAFFEATFRSATQTIVASNQALAPLLERFNSVKLLDSSVLQLPDSQKDRFAGTGGKNASGQAALKLQTELDLRSGGLECVQIEQGKDNDGASSRQRIEFQPGSLRVTDLGYFNLAVFASIALSKAFFLSRIPHSTIIWIDNERVGDVVSWLNQQTESLIDRWIEVGGTDRLPSRLIAWKVPPEQANRRRQRVRREACKHGRNVTEAALRACDWTFLITNVTDDQLSPKETIILYRARWQIELLFKRWKSVGLIAELSGKNDTEKMVRLWAKLCAALIQHWLTVMVAWNANSVYSFDRIAKQVSKIGNELLIALTSALDVMVVLERFVRTTKATCKRDRRSKAGTVELLRNPEKLDYSLS
jgi:Transposase DDE domain